jgi:hypothetical protein
MEPVGEFRAVLDASAILGNTEMRCSHQNPPWRDRPMHEHPDLQVKLFGYCSLDELMLRKAFLESGPRGLANLSGDYVIVVEKLDETFIISSPYGVCQYFYTVRNDRLFHGDTVIGVLKESGLSWSWNWSALGDVVSVGCLLENETLHPAIHRVPAAGVLQFRKGNLIVTTTPWEQLHPRSASGPDDVLAAFNREIKRWITENSVVSISGGFDSRAILSGFLHWGCKPVLVVMGFDDSTDVTISRSIARAFGLELRHVELELEDYLNHAGTIASLTNGTGMAMDWHSYIYLHKAGLDRKAEMFLGSNGEFVRTTIFDRGSLARIAQVTSPCSLRWLWQLKLRQRQVLTLGEILSPEFGKEFSPPQHAERIDRLIRLSHRSILPGFDRFYLEQVVRNSVSNGVKLCSAQMKARMPFLGHEWVRAAWNMRRKWKFGANWHRYAISRNCPKLLEFPEVKVGDRTAARSPWLYWLPRKRRKPVVPYQKCPEWFRSEKIAEFIRSQASRLGELVDGGRIDSILDEHRKNGNRTSAVSFLLTMASWVSQINQTLLGSSSKMIWGTRAQIGSPPDEPGKNI